MSGAPWLAIETSGDQASVALGLPAGILAEAVIEGRRRHATELLPAVDRVLAAGGAGLEAVAGIVISDGPGSFTGLRIGATVAKGLARARGIPVRTASALAVIARGAWESAGRTPGTVMVATDALRGEVYAALYRIETAALQVLRAPLVHRPDQLRGWPPADLVIAPGAPALDLQGRRGAADSVPPRASTLLRLLNVEGGTEAIAELETWEPAYGRPAEAQARWESAHGRPLPDPSGTSR